MTTKQSAAAEKQQKQLEARADTLKNRTKQTIANTNTNIDINNNNTNTSTTTTNTRPRRSSFAFISTAAKSLASNIKFNYQPSVNSIATDIWRPADPSSALTEAGATAAALASTNTAPQTGGGGGNSINNKEVSRSTSGIGLLNNAPTSISTNANNDYDKYYTPISTNNSLINSQAQITTGATTTADTFANSGTVRNTILRINNLSISPTNTNANVNTINVSNTQSPTNSNNNQNNQNINTTNLSGGGFIRKSNLQYHQQTQPSRITSTLSMKLRNDTTTNTSNTGSLSKEEMEEDRKQIEKEKSLSWEDKQKYKEHALKVRKEILTSEKVYVEKLMILYNNYIERLQTTKLEVLGIQESHRTALVSNVELQKNFHDQFLYDLETSGYNKYEEVFIKYASFFRMYTTYMSNYQKCLDTLQALRNNKLFSKFLHETSEILMKHGSDNLMSLMIMPVQRVPRYVQLQREQKRYTLSSSPVFSKINEAQMRISATAAHINETKRNIENMNTLVSIQQRIGGDFKDLNLIQPYRRLIREDEVIFRETKRGFFGTVKESPRILFLFNDIVQWTNKDLVFKNYIHLTSIRIEPCNDSSFEMSNFSLNMIVICPTKEIRDQWLKDISLQQQEQSTARQQKLLIKARNAHGHSSTHDRIVQSLGTLRNTMSKKDTIKMREQLQNMNLDDNATTCDDDITKDSKTKKDDTTNLLSVFPNDDINTKNEGANKYKVRSIAPRTTRSGAATVASSTLTKKMSELQEKVHT